ncbi:hypothetical protein QEH56_14295 [Pelagicoccus enzymogenes]|uniref:hypothetical protein n=1 Tax=Pelagicoccus enzymogenes TaxID=2773457 RepID=UPI00280DE3C9|nr:hypothetical protein [Pelagicoccus enzymogenes]MDQ8199336.1 hypothetical protein [Pelagicoccus enzymogenes]
MKPKRKSGFAIVLVAALAGLVFLLGASLVVITKLQTASADYDQRVRLAREHARAALEMAVADLQKEMGKDIAVSFTADTLSAAESDDFKTVRVGAAREPFWTGASQGAGNVNWLVTRRLDGTITLPTGTYSGPEIELLGEGTVGNNSLLKVKVPTDSVSVTGVDGFDTDSARTIGNYGYWIGDLGVKASYAWYDQLDEVAHDGYEVLFDPNEEVEGDEYVVKDRKERLRQLTIARPSIAFLDTDDTSDSPSNPERIDKFVSDFQFRSGFDGSDNDFRFLKGLTKEETAGNFHDFTPLAKGLLVDSERGGWRIDLSRDNSYEIAFRSFSNFWEGIGLEDNVTYEDYTLKVDNSYIPIVPAITQCNLNYALYFTEEAKLRIGLQATVEVWNPFSFAINLSGQRILLDVKDLPSLKIDLLNTEGSVILSHSSDISPAGGKIELVLTSFESGSQELRGGQIVVLSTSGDSEVEGESILLKMSDGTSGRYFLDDEDLTASPELDSIKLSFVDELGAPVSYNFSLDFSIDGTDSESGKDLVRVYALPYDYTLSGKSYFLFTEVEPARFGFSWKVDDSSLLTGGEYHPYYSTFSEYDIEAYETDASDGSNTVAAFSSAAFELLGFEPEIEEAGETDYDVPYLLLPKQEMTQVGQYSALTASNATGRYDISIAEPQGSDENNNGYFDKYFFSTIPKTPTDWSFGKTLPNANYVPLGGLTAFSTDPAEDLFVHGMFNVHSTSVDAWASILKGSPISKHPYWREVFSIDENVAVSDDLYLFMNHPLGGEDINILNPSDMPEIGSDLNPEDYPLEAKRASLRKNAFGLTEEQVNSLAGLIVKHIRTHVGGTGVEEEAEINPFDSLQEFVDSGVLQDAINELNSSESLAINPSWVIPGTPAEFRQSTILNLISGILSVRSDTFLVRAYGDAVDPADPTNVWAKAYCEAIVQRTHEEYGDDVPASTADIDRKFEVVAFRWLSPSEI